MPWKPIDLEDLHKLGTENEICPYFSSIDRMIGADIIFLPYNYIVD